MILDKVRLWEADMEMDKVWNIYVADLQHIP